MLRLTIHPTLRACFSLHFRQTRRSTAEGEAVVSGVGAVPAAEVGTAVAAVEVREQAEVQEQVEAPGAAVARAEAADREPDLQGAARVERMAAAVLSVTFHPTCSAPTRRNATSFP